MNEVKQYFCTSKHDVNDAHFDFQPSHEDIHVGLLDYEALLKSAIKVIKFYGDKELSARLMLTEEGGRLAMKWIKEHSDETL